MSYQQIQDFLSRAKVDSSSDEYSSLVCETEKEIARKILNKEITPEDSSFYQKAFDRVKGIEKFLTNKRIVTVGMGSVPVTLIYAQKIGLIKSGIGLDIDQEAINLATQLTSFLKVDGVIYLRANGVDFDFSETDVVFIANLVRGKANLLEKLSSQLSSGDHVILREPFEKGCYLNESAIDSIGPSWEIVGKDEPCPHFYSQSFYLRKV
ncbi:MAG: hypothetical protein NXH75_06810 [Halobacteriovoraceae bacterium]|nr:hypothetical protein [Halobacteriovoraceae bacterium]